MSDSNLGHLGKRKLKNRILNEDSQYITNAIVQPDNLTEVGVPIPDDENVEAAKEFQEENEK